MYSGCKGSFSVPGIIKESLSSISLSNQFDLGLFPIIIISSLNWTSFSGFWISSIVIVSIIWISLRGFSSLWIFISSIYSTWEGSLSIEGSVIASLKSILYIFLPINQFWSTSIVK